MKPCAFFASPDGCRNGSNCRFSHGAKITRQSDDGRPDAMKPCAFFASPDGCRNGSNCRFSHGAKITRQSLIHSHPLEYVAISTKCSICEDSSLDTWMCAEKSCRVCVCDACIQTPIPHSCTFISPRDKKLIFRSPSSPSIHDLSRRLEEIRELEEFESAARRANMGATSLMDDIYLLRSINKDDTPVQELVTQLANSLKMSSEGQTPDTVNCQVGTELQQCQELQASGSILGAADVVVVHGDESVFAHSVVLAARSQFYRSQLMGAWSGQNEIPVDDAGRKVLIMSQVSSTIQLDGHGVCAAKDVTTDMPSTAISRGIDWWKFTLRRSCMCPAGHHLSPSTGLPALYQQEDPTSKVICDICDKSGLEKGGQQLFHCNSCRFDVCAVCASLACPDGHPLQSMSKGLSSALLQVMCDGCERQGLEQVPTFYRCSVCNFDLCNNCQVHRRAFRTPWRKGRQGNYSESTASVPAATGSAASDATDAAKILSATEVDIGNEKSMSSDVTLNNNAGAAAIDDPTSPAAGTVAMGPVQDGCPSILYEAIKALYVSGSDDSISELFMTLGNADDDVPWFDHLAPAELCSCWLLLGYLDSPVGKGVIERALAATVTRTNAIELLHWAEEHQCEYIVRVTFSVLEREFIPLARENKLWELSHSTLCKLIESDTLQVEDELELLQVVMARDVHQTLRSSTEEAVSGGMWPQIMEGAFSWAAGIIGSGGGAGKAASTSQRDEQLQALLSLVRYETIPLVAGQWIWSEGQPATQGNPTFLSLLTKPKPQSSSKLLFCGESLWARNPAVVGGLATTDELENRFDQCLPRNTLRQLVMGVLKRPHQIISSASNIGGKKSVDLGAFRLRATPLNERIIKQMMSQQLAREKYLKDRRKSAGTATARMFHPTSGRYNFTTLPITTRYGPSACESGISRDSVSSSGESNECVELCSFAAVPFLPANYSLPSPATMAAMLQTEQALRLHPHTQQIYASPNQEDPWYVAHLIQLTVVRGFGYPDSYVRLLRAAKDLYSREELPWEQLPHYVRFNRSEQGSLREGDEAPDVPLVFIPDWEEAVEHKGRRRLVWQGDGFSEEFDAPTAVVAVPAATTDLKHSLQSGSEEKKVDVMSPLQTSPLHSLLHRLYVNGSRHFNQISNQMQLPLTPLANLKKPILIAAGSFT